MSLADCESCLSLSRQNGELRRAYDEMFKRSCEKTVYIAECEDAIDGLRGEIGELITANEAKDRTIKQLELQIEKTK